MDKSRKLGLNIAILLLCTCCGSIADQCLPLADDNDDGYRLWAGAEKRATTYQTNTDIEIAICDMYIDTKWYRVESLAGETMPETCIEAANVCGTVFPVWMDGTHPTNVNQIVDRRACVSNYLFDTNCCMYEWDIKVSKCEDANGGPDFFVYYLVPASGCDIGYCFGQKEKCQVGTSSTTGYEPCTALCGADPITQIDITVHEAENQEEMEFHCNFNYIIQPGEEVSVVWFLDNKRVAIKKVTTGSFVTLAEDDWVGTYRLGFHASCTAQYSTTGCVGEVHENPDPFFAGIKILNSPLTIKEGETKELEFQLTVPFLPPVASRATDIAFLDVSVHAPDQPDTNAPECVNNVANVNQMAFGGLRDTATPCGLRITHTSQGDVLEGNPATLKVPVTAKINGIIDGNRQRLIKLDTFKLFWHTAWEHSSTGEAQIIIEDVDGPSAGVQCSSYNDPHMTNFEGEPFEHHIAGEYILYKHEDLPIQVNTFFKNCNGHATCNCAVAVQAGRDVLVFDKCHTTGHGNVRKNDLRLGAFGCDGLGKGLRVVESGTGYQIFLPTGAVVIISNDWYFNVVVRPAHQDFDKTTGLCGRWNGDRSDDFVSRPGSDFDFNKSWRVDSQDSLYKGTPRHPSTANLYGHVYCTCSCDQQCQEATIDCDNKIYALCAVNSDISYAQRNKCWERSKKKKRDTLLPDIEDEELKDFDPEELDDGDTTPTWPTASNIIESEARVFCEERLLRSTLGKTCQHLQHIGYSPEHAAEDCISDILMSDGYDWIKSTEENLRESCATALTKNLTLYEEENGIQVPPKVLKNLCPENCSGNGDCATGSCTCFDGFFGSKCSLSNSDPPTIYSVVRDGLCDFKTRMCQSLTLKGENFYNSPNLTCHTQPVQVGSDTLTRLGNSLQTSAVYEYSAQVRCPIPAWPEELISNGDFVKGFLVSVSNDGETPGSEYLFVRYDPSCEVCNTTTQRCSKRTDVCVIDGFCYDNGFRPDWDECAECDITEAKTNWTVKKDTQTCQARCLNGAVYNIGSPYSCMCVPGYTGLNCETFMTMTCENKPCINDGKCTDDINGFRCECPKGYSGTHCEILDDPCKVNPCLNRGHCVQNENTYKCVCETPYYGKQCELGPCSTTPCLNDGTCTRSEDTYKCKCKTGFEGKSCGVKVSSCDRKPCSHFGQCVEYNDGFRCECKLGYGGTTCQLEIPVELMFSLPLKYMEWNTAYENLNSSKSQALIGKVASMVKKVFGEQEGYRDFEVSKFSHGREGGVIVDINVMMDHGTNRTALQLAVEGLQKDTDNLYEDDSNVGLIVGCVLGSVFGCVIVIGIVIFRLRLASKNVVGQNESPGNTSEKYVSNDSSPSTTEPTNTSDYPSPESKTNPSDRRIPEYRRPSITNHI